ncbi:MAG: hypothetical protein R3Y35_13135 [Clostridia bacterium]
MAEKEINQNEYAELVNIAKFLIDIHKISKLEAEISLERLKNQYNAKPIYLW